MKLNPREEELYRAVDEVLHYLWDPIGISSIPEARDEYYGYFQDVFDLVRNGAAHVAIATYLCKVVTDRMGLPANAHHDQEVARVLVAWRIAVAAKAA